MRGRYVTVAAVAVGVLVARAQADVNIGITFGGPPSIVVAEPPRMVLVPRSPVYWAPSLPYNFFYYDGRYWTYHEGGWFWSASVHGPWGHVAMGAVPRPVLAVPVAYYRVPPGHMKHHHHGPPPWAGRGRGHRH
jgi:hypothetical protein